MRRAARKIMSPRPLVLGRQTHRTRLLPVRTCPKLSYSKPFITKPRTRIAKLCAGRFETIIEELQEDEQETP